MTNVDPARREDAPLDASARVAQLTDELSEARAELERTRALLDQAQRDLRAAAQREEDLNDEVQHRARNVLTIVRSIFGRTVRTRDSLEDAADHFRGRLDALARNQPGWARSALCIEVEDLVRNELLEARADADPRISIDGPTASLGSKNSELLGLALHELATNSIKFGVLADTGGGGRLAIQWQAQAGRLHFTWRESGVAIVSSAPLRIGYGREFIEQSMPYQSDTRTSFQIAPGTITCIIDMPLAGPDPARAGGL